MCLGDLSNLHTYLRKKKQISRHILGNKSWDMNGDLLDLWTNPRIVGSCDVVSAIPTLPPQKDSIVSTPQGLRPGWSTQVVFSPHVNSRGKNVACSPDAIWNPLVGPHDFTTKRWNQAKKAFQVFFNFHASNED